jgi:hypothetical protein
MWIGWLRHTARRGPDDAFQRVAEGASIHDAHQALLAAATQRGVARSLDRRLTQGGTPTETRT